MVIHLAVDLQEDWSVEIQSLEERNSLEERWPLGCFRSADKCLQEENRRLVAATGFCVWLKVDVETVLARLTRDAATTDRRPALTTLPQREEIASMLATREPIYESVSNLAIDVTGKQVQEIADEVIAAIKWR